jgi:ATP-dependent DNA helicase RecQ
MGIDRPDITRVVHWELPGSLEAYYQEIGRGGRDGRAAEAILLWNFADVRTREFLIELEDDDDRRRAPVDPRARERRKELDRRKLRRMIDYAESPACLRGTVLRYFGDPSAPARCGSCGSCRRRRALDGDDLLLVRKVLSGVARGGERFGRRRVAAMLAGDLEGLPESLHNLSTTGLLRELGAKTVERWVDALVAAGLLRATEDEYRTLSITPEGREVMAGRKTDVELSAPGADVPSAGTKREKKARAAAGAVEAPVDEALLARLKEWRREEAAARRVPAYVVFADKTLAALAAARPGSSAELTRVPGIGPAKLALYGETLLRLMAES